MYFALFFLTFSVIVPRSVSGAPKNTTSPASAKNCNPVWPTATGTQVVNETEIVEKEKDCGMKRLTAGPNVGGNTVNEKDKPILMLKPGATLSNCIFGKPSAKGVWCQGPCTLKNCWWEDVATHAAGFGTDPKYWADPKNTYNVVGGGAKNALEKVFIQQGAGTTTITDFFAKNVSKLVRSCGDCNPNFKNRKIVIKNTTVVGPVLGVVGVNGNFGDTVDIKGLNLCDSKQINAVCQGYEGNALFDQKTQINIKTSAKENIKPGEKMEGPGCADPNAVVNVIS